MTATILGPYLKQRFVDANGAALYQGTLSTFAAGTVTPIGTWKDPAGGSLNTNPIILNPRGECDLYLLPNVAYKFVLADQFGNLVWTVDNIVNSQLITLFAGVDTGTINAYVLNFSASFSAYTDGIVLYWIPANSNSGPSTLNVNGLGVVNILNPDGSALSAGEIIANQPAQLLFKSGAFELITPATTAVGTFAPSWNGFSVPPSGGQAIYRRTGNIVALTLIFLPGTSSSAQFSLSGLPAAIQTFNTGQIVPCPGLVDAGVTLAAMAVAQIKPNLITFFKSAASLGGAGDWTPTGAKGFGTNCFPTLVYNI